jgi:hypothetical protein
MKHESPPFVGELIVIVLAIALIMAGCALSKGCERADATERPPAPLQIDTYASKGGYDAIRRVYDATTGHTWWVLEREIGRQSQHVVLDTAGTEAHG